MISQISGKVLEVGTGSLIVDVGGIGFRVLTPAIRTAITSDQTVTVYTHLHHKEDSMDLYGFLTKDELALFESLISVSSVGPKTALSILSINSAETLKSAIHKSKPELLVGPGVGKKTAERIILELSGKLTIVGSNSELVDALLGLGYSPSDARSAASQVKDGDLQSQIKAALAELRK